MRFVLTLILVAWAMPAVAQISSGPTGNLALVDDNGELIGGYFPLRQDSVMISTPQANGSIHMEFDDDSGVFLGFRASTIHFTNADCTGQAYGFGGTQLDSGAVLLSHDQILYGKSGPITSVAVASQQHPDGTCGPGVFTDLFYPFTAVGDISAVWTPPFHLVSLSSLQSASVPMQIGWLLGGLLLGLGLKRAMGR